MDKKLIKCPICGTVLPADVEFCVYCATQFDFKNIEYVDNCTELSNSDNDPYDEKQC